MSEWKEFILGDILDIKHGFAFKGEFFSTNPTSNVLLTPGNFKIGGGFKDDKLKYYNGDIPNDYILKGNSIIISMTDLSKDGDTIGYPAKVPFHSHLKYLHNQRLGLLQFKNKDIVEDYIYWLLRTKEYQNFIRNSATGTTVKHTSPSRIKEFRFKAPKSTNTQKKIAFILTSLENKIELNHQINQTLEAIAQTLFKEWFVNFNFPGATGKMQDSELGMIPEGWRVGKLGEVCRNKRDSINPKDIQEPIPYFGLEHISRKNLSVSFWGDSNQVDSQKFKFSKNDILFGKLRPYFHKVAIAPLDGICSTDILVIQPIQPSLFSFVLNHLFDDTLIGFVSAVADGTRMPRVDWKSIANYSIIIPPINIAEHFNSITQAFYEKMLANIFENQTLIALRDSLLPRLMQGEVMV